MEHATRNTILTLGTGAIAGICFGALVWRGRSSQVRVTLLKASEGEAINIRPADREKLAQKVVGAFYGRPGHLWDVSQGRDVTSKVRKLLSAGKRLAADNSIFGDPVPGELKMLVVAVSENSVILGADQEQDANEEEEAQPGCELLTKDTNKAPVRPVHSVLRPGSDPRVDQAMYVRYEPPPERKSGAIIIVCQGGNYDECNVGWGESQDVAQWLVEQGITAIVLQYRLVCAGHYWPAQFDDWQDCARAVKEDAASWGCDPERIGVLGFSAGGHLSGYAALQADVDIRPKLQILVYPAINTLSPLEDGAMDAWRADRGYPPSEASIHLLGCHQAPPTFLAGIKADRFTPTDENTDVYAQKLSEFGIPYEYVLSEDEDTEHGCSCEDWWTVPCEAWLQSHGWGLPPDNPAASADE